MYKVPTTRIFVYKFINIYFDTTEIEFQVEFVMHLSS